MYDRRAFLSKLAKATAVGTAGLHLIDPDALVEEALAAPELLPPWVANVRGNGRVGRADENLVRKAIRTRRGRQVIPRDGFDVRMDVLGTGRVTRPAYRSVEKTRKHLDANPGERRARPVTVCWHYGWFNHEARRPRKHHVWFKGGGYSSRSPRSEALFNDLKNECGITVDALSWADPRVDGNLNRNLELGYLNARNGDSRYTALLYESLLSLRAEPGDRIDFTRNLTRKRLIQNFRDMARFFKQVEESPARVFRVDGRPVIFIYASHTWGLNVDGTGEQYLRIDEAMENAIANFQAIYGTAPFLVGEETTFAESDRFDLGRQRRSANFDAVFVYHHATGGDFIVRGGSNLRGAYVEQVKEVLSNTYEGVLEHRNRFTDRQLLVIPSFAAGFSKDGVPTLFANRGDYGDFLKEMVRFHEEEFHRPLHGEARFREVPPIVTVGSWNEEWEGHAVMPSRFNRTLSPRLQGGFDLTMAIKQAFGWNHYAKRDLSLD